MNSFKGKRKARVIKVDDEGDSSEAAPAVASGDATKDGEYSCFPHATFTDADQG